MRNIKRFFQLLLFLSLIIAIAFLQWGCDLSDTGTGTDGGNNGPVDPADSLAAILKVQEANAALADVLYEWANNPEPEDPSDIDFTVSNTLYNLALNLDYRNVDANFGVGFCGLMMIAMDPEINAAWDEWSAFLDTTELFKPPGSGPIGYQPSLPGFPTSMENFADFPLTMIPATIGGMVAMSTNDLPMFSDIQYLMQTELIPRLEDAYDRLDYVDNHPDYTFTVTPLMQGDPYEDYLELDLTEIYAMETALLAADAFARILISYNVNFASYDSLGLLQAFDQSSSNSFLSLKSSGASHLSTAKSHLISALDKAEAGITFLEGETDNQNDDIIKVDPGDEDDLDSIKAYINYAQDALAGSWTYTQDWDDDPLTPDVPVTWNLAAFFDTPIQDFKALLPDYEVSIELESAGGWDWHSDQVNVTASIQVPVAEYYYWWREYSWSEWGGEWDNSDSNISIPEFESVFNGYIASMQNNPGIPYFYLWLDWSNTLVAGIHLISDDLYMEWNSSEYRYVVVLTYTEDYANWIFPNPTFNGLLPGMTDANFKSTFGMGYDDWQDGLEFHF